MPTTYPDISLPINLARFHIPTAEAAFSFTDENGLHLDTGGDANYALASVPVANGLAPALVGAIEYLKPQTLTLAYATMHLVAGMTVDLNYNFASIDESYKDFAFAVLEDSSGSAQPALLYDSKRFAQDLGGLTGASKLYALFQGHHGGEHFTVDHTGDYTLVAGVADVGDKTGTTELALTDVSIGLPGGLYSASVSDHGLLLSDGSVLRNDGAQLPNASATHAADGVAPLIAPAGQGIIGMYFNQALAAQNALRAAAASSGLLAANAGGTINPLAGGQASQTVLTNYPGIGQVAVNNSALLSENGAGLLSAADARLISQDGGGIVSHDAGGLISQDGGGLISQDGGGLISQDGGGIVSHDAGGLISQDGGGVVSNDGASLAGTGATGLFTLNGSGIAGDQASVEGTLTNAATASTFDSLPVTRSYTLTGDPSVTPAKPPVAGAEAVLSPAAAPNVSDQAPAVAGLSNGKYVSVWSDNFAFTDGSGIVFNDGNPEIRGQVFNADGTKSGAVLDISQVGGRSKTQPSVTGLAGGRFVVTWTGYDLSNGLRTQIVAQFYNADGTKSGASVFVNPAAPTQSVQNQSTVASLFDGGAIVAYRVTNGSGFTVLEGQRFAADGTAVGGTIAIGGKAGFSVTDQTPAATGLQDGGFVVAYAEPDAFRSVGGVATDTNGIYVQRFSSGGASVGAPVQVNTATAQRVSGLDSPAVAVLQDGSYVVAYRSEPAGSSNQATVLAQHFALDGTPLGGELTVATNAASSSNGANPDNAPTITALHEGGYAVAWAVAANSPAPATIFAQAFAADGTRQGAPFIASKSGVNLDYGSPAAVTLGDGRLLVAGTTYDSSLGALGGSDIRAEAFSFPTTQAALTTYGRVLDGIVTGATVFADANGNGSLDAGEATAVTDAKGRFTFTTPAAGPVVATGGTDASTGLPFTGTYTAPAGSLSVTALTTLVQKVMAANGSSVGDAMGQVALALGLSLNTDMTSLNPITSTLNGVGDAAQALVADAMVTNTLALAKAAGATGDLYGKLASQIADASYGKVDLTSSATVQGLGVDPIAAIYVSSFAKAGADLLAAKLASGESALTLVHDVTGANTVLQGAAAPDLAAGQASGSFLGPLVNKYTGDNLAAQVDAGSAKANGTPYGISYTDVDTAGLGYTNGDVYGGPVAGLQHQYIWASSHKAAIGATSPNVFLHGGSGDDAMSVTGGINVLDGGTGSNFLVGASGTGAGAGSDTFFVDGRGGAVTWSTIVNFHQGDAATIFGFNPGVSTQPFTAVDGVSGYQGLTIHSELGGVGTGVNASMTFAGIDQATADAHFTITSGVLGAGTSDVTGYLYIQYDH